MAPSAENQQRSSQVEMAIAHHTKARNESWYVKRVKREKDTKKGDNLRKEQWGTCLYLMI